jgi:hypothetical protein
MLRSRTRPARSSARVVGERRSVVVGVVIESRLFFRIVLNQGIGQSRPVVPSFATQTESWGSLFVVAQAEQITGPAPLPIPCAPSFWTRCRRSV